MIMEKILGLDLGTNSIGWAIVERDGNRRTLAEHGVDIFQEGVEITKSGEEPSVKERTDARALRRHYFRRRLRKIELLKVLVAHDLCPALTDEQLDAWRYEKRYPTDDEFLLWQRTDDNRDKNPYHDRFKALTVKLDMNDRGDRHLLGRALYHLAQRRGFLSNRKDLSEDSDGKVHSGISELSAEIKAAGCTYLGEYFYRLYCRGEKIRSRYTDRQQHYLAEFDAVCDKQQLTDELRSALHRAIFYQRPLKSQRGSVGKCRFEKGKNRCPVSHPRFEEYRMLQVINNIKVRTYADDEYRPLNDEEREKAKSAFYRKTAFDVETIAKAVAGRKKGSYACEGDECDAPYRFNWRKSQSIASSPVTHALREIFGSEWEAEICSRYLKGDGKSSEQIVNDVWHALFSFDNNDKLRQWGICNLQLTDDEADKFVKIDLPRDYAALSLNAIDKMLPYLRDGYRYDQAVFLANLASVVGDDIWSDPKRRRQIASTVGDTLRTCELNPYDRTDTKENRIKDALLYDCGIPEASLRLDKLYHPSMTEIYPEVRPDDSGLLQLASPQTDSLRNPMAMRALHRLRALVNTLLREGKIDAHTKINIEFARRLNTANMRRAIDRHQRINEAKNKKYADAIKELYRDHCGAEVEPTDNDILKYRLWQEQNHICPYTGHKICICDFIGPDPRFDIEHTVPRSRGGDNSLMNKTLCERHYNREVKGTKLPSQLPDYEQILARIESFGWKKEIDDLQKQIERTKNGSYATKAIKDEAIQKRHRLQMDLDYKKGKYDRFTMEEKDLNGFSNRQGVDIGVIGKYARSYLKSVFKRIYIVKGSTTADFRKAWGLQEEYTAKERTNHAHHCIDAVTIACIGRQEYDDWKHYAEQIEGYELGQRSRPEFPKPWPTFAEDVQAIASELLVSHHTRDNMPSRSRRALRKRGKVMHNDNGDIIYMQGDTARGVLHQDTFYGAIKRDDGITYVVRKSLGQLQESDIKKIVDDVVRQKVEAAVAEHGFKQAMSGTIWMNEQKGVQIKSVRIFATNLTNPIELKTHRDRSPHAHKQHYHVVNDANYCMAVYEGTTARGKCVRTYEVVNNLDAARIFNGKGKRDTIAPLSDGKGYPLKWILKTGTMVLFYENSAEELYDCTTAELTRRLYKVTGFSILNSGNNSYGRMTFKHHQEARPAGDLKAKNGLWKIGEDYRPAIQLLHTQFNMYVEGYDFDLTVTGEIKFKH